VPEYPLYQATVFAGKDHILGTADDVRPYNNFFQQQTYLDQYGVTYLPFPNIEWKREPVATIEGNTATFDGCFINTGEAALQDPIFISYYKNDTILANFIKTDTLHRYLMPGDSISFELTLDRLDTLVPYTSLWISVNDNNGKEPFPYQKLCTPWGRYEIKLCGNELMPGTLSKSICSDSPPDIDFTPKPGATVFWRIVDVENVDATTFTEFVSGLPIGDILTLQEDELSGTVTYEVYYKTEEGCYSNTETVVISVIDCEQLCPTVKIAKDSVLVCAENWITVGATYGGSATGVEMDTDGEGELKYYNTADRPFEITYKSDDNDMGNYVKVWVTATMEGTIPAPCPSPTDSLVIEVPDNLDLCNTIVELIVFLEGPTDAYEQLYKDISHEIDSMCSNSQGQLPEMDSICKIATYNDIKNPLGPLGQLIDWVLVEIWNIDSVARTYYLVDSAVLLLKPDGRVVDVGGSLPVFKWQPESEDTRIVVKQRNHLAVVSRRVSFEQGGYTEYNFSTGLDKALGLPGNSPPMMQLHTKYCMWGGDLNQDGIIDADDSAVFLFGLVTGNEGDYNISDMNFCTIIGGRDQFIFNKNLNGTKSSPVLLFKRLYK
jgi:hypothetical protein